MRAIHLLIATCLAAAIAAAEHPLAGWLQTNGTGNVAADRDAANRRPVLGYLTNTVAVTTAIPAEVQQASQVFSLLLQSHLGPGAHTNREVPRSVIEAYFIGKRLGGTMTESDAADMIILKELWVKLLSTGLSSEPDETWTFPWGQSEVARTSVVIAVEYGQSPAETLLGRDCDGIDVEAGWQWLQTNPVATNVAVTNAP